MSRLVCAPIETPSIPFVFNIPSDPKVGLIIRIQGRIPYNATRFDVNVANGPRITEPGLSDILFHFNPRFDSKYVARNTLVNGVWGQEEYANPSNLPFCQNQAFEIMILFEPHEYKVAVDGTHFLEYKHRVPLNEATTLQILGNVNIFKVEFLDSCSPSSGACVGFEQMFSPVGTSDIINPSIPLRHLIVGGLKPGRSIFLTGRPKPYCKRFYINLEQSGGTADQPKQICFHFNPRFGDMGDEPQSVIVRNTFEDGQWGTEERHTPFFPFHHGFNFDMTILCEVLDLMVAVNGQHLISYKHRVPYENVDSFRIEGELDVMLVRLQ